MSDAATRTEHTDPAGTSPMSQAPGRVKAPSKTSGKAPAKASGKSSKKNSKKKRAKSSGGLSPRECVLVVVTVVAVAAAIVGALAATGFGPFASLSSAQPTGAAAKVDDFYVMEDDVETYIEQYRASYSITDDDDFAQTLSDEDTSVSTFRKTAIDQLALNQLILNRAEELDVMPTDEECQAQLDVTKEAMSLGDEDTWADTLEMYSLTEEDLLEQYEVNLAQDAICEADVERRDANDDEILSYLQNTLAGSTQYHAYRIVFTGDDAVSDATDMYEAMSEMQDEGKLDVEMFSYMALEYSDDENVADDGGSYAWTGSEMADEVKEGFEDGAEEGSLIGTFEVEEDDAVELIYCDDSYTFADSDDLTELPDDVPDALWAEIEDAAADEVFDTNSSSYLAWLLAQAKITYYPVPDDAPYAVDVYETMDLNTGEDVDDDTALSEIAEGTDDEDVDADGDAESADAEDETDAEDEGQ